MKHEISPNDLLNPPTTGDIFAAVRASNFRTTVCIIGFIQTEEGRGSRSEEPVKQLSRNSEHRGISTKARRVESNPKGGRMRTEISETSYKKSRKRSLKNLRHDLF